MEREINWTDFKAKESGNSILFEANGSGYLVWLWENQERFYTRLTVAADITEFENDYKADAGKPFIQKTHSSSKPRKWDTFFQGDDDNANHINLKVGTGDNFKKVELEFADQIKINSGYLISKDAPFGAYVDIQLLDSDDNVIRKMADRIYIMGDHIYPFETENSSTLKIGEKIRVKAWQSSGTGDDEAKVDFYVTGYIKLYKAEA